MAVVKMVGKLPLELLQKGHSPPLAGILTILSVPWELFLLFPSPPWRDESRLLPQLTPVSWRTTRCGLQRALCPGPGLSGSTCTCATSFVLGLACGMSLPKPGGQEAPLKAD